MNAIDVAHLRRALELARLSRAHGNQPFGSLLVGRGGGRASLSLDARELFARGNRRVLVEGPCAELEVEAREVHAGFWG